MGSKKGYFFKKKLTLFAFVLPGAAFMTIMIIFPIISNIIMSFKNVDLMNFATGDSHFVGLKIYQKICRTEVTWIAVKNTLVFTLWCLVFPIPHRVSHGACFSARILREPDPCGPSMWWPG